MDASIQLLSCGWTLKTLQNEKRKFNGPRLFVDDGAAKFGPD